MLFRSWIQLCGCNYILMKALGLFLVLVLAVSSFDKLINPNATVQAQNLYQKLIDNNGKAVFSGQTTFNYDNFVTQTGQFPMVRGFDMQNYSPNNPWYSFKPYDDGTVSLAIDWFTRMTNRTGIVTFFWHWFSPINGWERTSTFYTSNTGFDVSKAIINGTAEYKAVIRDIDAIAVQLKRLMGYKIPIIWRPLHEAGGGWFWWGAKGSCAAIGLYNLMYERLTSYHRINNLIWSWSTPEADWYPGNSRVDIFGYDSYPGNNNYSCLDTIYNQLKTISFGNKIIALTENGPIPNMDTCLASGIKWSFFMSWSDLVFSQNDMAHIKSVFALSIVKSLPSTTLTKAISGIKSHVEIPDPIKSRNLVPEPRRHLKKGTDGKP